MPRPYNKIFVAEPPEFDLLPFRAQEVFHSLHGRPIEPDGTVAAMDEKCPTAHAALVHRFGVPVNDRKRWKSAIKILLEKEVLIVDGDRLKLANWEDRQAWRKGPVPPPMGTARSCQGSSKGTPMVSDNPPESVVVRNGKEGENSSLLLSSILLNREDPEVSRVVDHWSEVFGSHGLGATDTDRDLIRDRLAERLTPNQLIEAIDKAASDDFYSQHWRIKSIFKNQESVILRTALEEKSEVSNGDAPFNPNVDDIPF